jgi:hypothetical protein
MRHEPESKKQKLIQEESGVGIYSGDTVLKNTSFVTPVYNKESQSVTILPFADIVPVSVIT